MSVEADERESEAKAKESGFEDLKDMLKKAYTKSEEPEETVEEPEQSLKPEATLEELSVTVEELEEALMEPEEAPEEPEQPSKGPEQLLEEPVQPLVQRKEGWNIGADWSVAEVDDSDVESVLESLAAETQERAWALAQRTQMDSGGNDIAEGSSSSS